MGELSKHAEESREGVLQRVTELNVSRNKIGDNGIACIATALQTYTTMRTLDVSWCDISDVGAESLARALADNGSLLKLYISNNQIVNNGLACIATALQTNYTLKTITVNYKTVTDEGVVLLLSALTTNRSMENLSLDWSSSHPDSTLKEIGECVTKSTLRTLELYIHRPRSPGETPTVEQVKEWLQCVEVGGKELIQSLENIVSFKKFTQLRRIVSFKKFLVYVHKRSDNCDVSGHGYVCQALEAAAAATVNFARTKKGFRHTLFTFE